MKTESSGWVEIIVDGKLGAIRPSLLRKRERPLQQGLSAARPVQLLRFLPMWCMVLRQMCIEMECNQIRTMRSSLCRNREGLHFQQGLARVKRLLTPLIIHFRLNKKAKFGKGISQAKMNIVLPQSTLCRHHGFAI